jgi:hypothetical protein
VKKNVKEITQAIQKIKQIRGVSYKRIWRDVDGNITKIAPTKTYGFVAQEISLIIPEAVLFEGENKFGTVLYGQLIAVSIQAMKEQKLILDDSEKRLEILEGIAKEKGLI